MNDLKAVILDIDGTLSPDISWYKLTEGLGASVDEHKAIFDSFKQGNLDYDKAKKKLIGLWQTSNNANSSYITKLLHNWQLYPDVVTTVAKIQAAGYQLCIISGTFDLWAKTVAKRLGIEHYYANSVFVWDNQGNLVDIHYELKQGEKKLNQFKSYCKQVGLIPQECLVTGNSDNDIDIFELSVRGVAVGSDVDKALTNVAWQTVNKFSDIMQFLVKP